MTWNPDMSAAPRDGTAVLVRSPLPTVASYDRGAWWAMSNGKWVYGLNGTPIRVSPDEWMPLPPPLGEQP